MIQTAYECSACGCLHPTTQVVEECKRINASKVRNVAADRMAYAIAKLVERRIINSRSAAADALLDYLEIGAPDGPSNVPEWVAKYEASDVQAERNEPK